MPCGMRGVPTVMNKPITRDIEFKKPTPPTEGGEHGEVQVLFIIQE